MSPLTRRQNSPSAAAAEQNKTYDAVQWDTEPYSVKTANWAHRQPASANIDPNYL